VVNPVLTLNVFSGDLGIDDGTPRSVYTLEVDGLTQHTGGDTAADSLELTPAPPSTCRTGGARSPGRRSRRRSR
jgi:cytochrome c biogenesis protein